MVLAVFQVDVEKAIGKIHNNGVVVVFTYQDLIPLGQEQLSTTAQNMVSLALKNNLGGFDGKYKSCISLSCADQDSIYTLLIVGLGKREEFKPNKARNIGGYAYRTAFAKRATNLVIVADNVFDDASSVPALCSGVRLAAYRFDHHITVKENDHTLDSAKVVFNKAESVLQHLEEEQRIDNSIMIVRDFANQPPNVINTESYAEEILKLFDNLPVNVTIFDEQKMAEMGMNAILAVGQGSIYGSKLIIMEYDGIGKGSGTQPLALVGKGVMFDTGGISLKPGTDMDTMKYDMAGSAAVVATMFLLAQRKAKAHVVGAIPVVENMVGSKAYRPGDIIKSMSGQTMEILNTDAEGRVILSDALHYVNTTHKPVAIVDLATLTGAIRIALGDTFAGCFANDDVLAEKINKAAERSGENVWRMPLHPDFADMIKSPVADVANLGVKGLAGSATGAHFLEKFVGKTPWAHLDIAGVASTSKSTDICVKGATGYGVRLLNQLVKDNYEQQ